LINFTKDPHSLAPIRTVRRAAWKAGKRMAKRTKPFAQNQLKNNFLQINKTHKLFYTFA